MFKEVDDRPNLNVTKIIQHNLRVEGWGIIAECIKCNTVIHGKTADPKYCELLNSEIDKLECKCGSVAEYMSDYRHDKYNGPHFKPICKLCAIAELEKWRDDQIRFYTNLSFRCGEQPEVRKFSGKAYEAEFYYIDGSKADVGSFPSERLDVKIDLSSFDFCTGGYISFGRGDNCEWKDDIFEYKKIILKGDRGRIEIKVIKE